MNKRPDTPLIDSAVAALNLLGVPAKATAVLRSIRHADAMVTVRQDGKTFRMPPKSNAG
jgi:hypothetical protein